MEPTTGRSPTWLMADGAASISASMLVSVLLNVVPSFAGLWGLGFFQELTNKQDGMIVVATLLLLPTSYDLRGSAIPSPLRERVRVRVKISNCVTPTSFAVYGVSQVIFAAKEAVEKRAMEKGRKVERERFRKELEELEKSGVEIPPEVARIIVREYEDRS